MRAGDAKHDGSMTVAWRDHHAALSATDYFTAKERAQLVLFERASSNPLNTDPKKALATGISELAFEPLRNCASAVFSTRKPFDVLIEGLYSETSRGDRTGFELFVEGIRLWEPETRFLLTVKP